MPGPSRRQLLSALAVAAVAPLTACPAPPGPTASVPPTATPSPSPSQLPFGLESPSRVEAVIFDGAFGTGYVERAAATLEDTYPGVAVTVTPADDVLAAVGDRLTEGAIPPDLIDNSGTSVLPIAELADTFEVLDDLMASESLDGGVLSDSLYHDVLASGTFNGRLIAVNYALSVFGLWYSASEFAAQGWAVPAAWDQMLVLGQAAQADGRGLFVWADDAADYFQELAITSAIKEGGHEVRVALDNLADGAWSHPAVAAVLKQMEACVEAGLFVAGGSYLDAQAAWLDGAALLYPAGAWLPTEMSDVVPEGYELTVAPVPTVTAAPMLPPTALHAAPTEQFLVPSAAANVAGAKALLRIMLSRDAAGEFSRTHLIPTIVRESVPADVASSALASQSRLMADAGEDVFTWRFVEYYGLGPESNAAWADFLSGTIRSEVLAARLQTLSDRVRKDPDVERYTVS